MTFFGLQPFRHIFRSNFLDLCCKTRKLSSHCCCSICAYVDTKWPFVFLICDCSRIWIILQLWCQLEKTMHITNLHAHLPEKYIAQKWAISSVDSSAWIVFVCHGNSLILSNNWSSTSSATSLICLVMVLVERGRFVTFLTDSSLKSSLQMSLVAGKINSSPIVKGFLSLAIHLWSVWISCCDEPLFYVGHLVFSFKYSLLFVCTLQPFQCLINGSLYLFKVIIQWHFFCLSHCTKILQNLKIRWD